MHAILVHVIGFIVLNSLIPDWVESASRDALIAWYAGFVIIDFLALTVCWDKRVKVVLSLSCAWSACILAEICIGTDKLQQLDGFGQGAIDAAIVVVSILLTAEWLKSKRVAVDGGV